MKVRAVLALIVLSLFSLSACSIVENIAPPPAATEIPTPKSEDPTPTPEPTLGEPEVYQCGLLLGIAYWTMANTT